MLHNYTGPQQTTGTPTTLRPQIFFNLQFYIIDLSIFGT